MTISFITKKGIVPERLKISDILANKGILFYSGSPEIDIFTLNEVLYEYSDLTNLEFDIVCAFLYSKYYRDLGNLQNAVRDYKLGKFEFIKILDDGSAVKIDSKSVKAVEAELNNRALKQEQEQNEAIQKNSIELDEISSDNIDYNKIFEDEAHTNLFTTEEPKSDMKLLKEDIEILCRNGYDKCPTGLLKITEV